MGKAASQCQSSIQIAKIAVPQVTTWGWHQNPENLIYTDVKQPVFMA